MFSSLNFKLRELIGRDTSPSDDDEALTEEPSAEQTSRKPYSDQLAADAEEAGLDKPDIVGGSAQVPVKLTNRRMFGQKLEKPDGEVVTGKELAGLTR
jgi:hypothetical protein